MTTGSLPASARALRDGRLEVDIAYPIEPGRYRVYLTGRFVLSAYDDAVRWIDDHAAVGHVYTVTRYAASNGWRPQSVATGTKREEACPCT